MTRIPALSMGVTLSRDASTTLSIASTLLILSSPPPPSPVLLINFLVFQ